MKPFPLTQKVLVRQWVEDAEDMFGNTTSGWGPDNELSVFGWASPSSEELAVTVSAQNRIIWNLNLYAPSGAITHRDRVIIGQESFEVVGIENYDHGPEGWLKPGLEVIKLKKVDG